MAKKPAVKTKKAEDGSTNSLGTIPSGRLSRPAKGSRIKKLLSWALSPLPEAKPREAWEWEGKLKGKNISARFFINSIGAKSTPATREEPGGGEAPEMELDVAHDEHGKELSLSPHDRAELEELASDLYYEEIYGEQN